MWQLDSEVVDIPSLELVGIVCAPCSHHIEAEQRTGVVADNVVEECIMECHAVSVATTIERANLCGCCTTQTIVDELIEECGRVETQTLVQGILCILVIY